MVHSPVGRLGETKSSNATTAATATNITHVVVVNRTVFELTGLKIGVATLRRSCVQAMQSSKTVGRKIHISAAPKPLAKKVKEVAVIFISSGLTLFGNTIDNFHSSSFKCNPQLSYHKCGGQQKL